MFIVELEKGTWLAPWPGDPGRTVVLEHAKYYKTSHGANIALGMARRYRKFDNAMVIPLDNTQHQ